MSDIDVRHLLSLREVKGVFMALVRLLIDKGVFSEEEIVAAIEASGPKP